MSIAHTAPHNSLPGALPNCMVANRYEIERLAGSGGMGAVYRARDSHTNEWVALKVLHAGSSGSQETERFTREAQLLSELRHPGIVSYVAHGELTDGRPYLAMEWLDGEDLGTRLRRSLLSLTESVELLRHVAAALALPHKRGIVHRDLRARTARRKNQEKGGSGMDRETDARC